MKKDKSQNNLLNKLKKQVRMLQKREEHTRAKLKNALKKMRKLGKNYKIKLAGKIRLIKGKIAAVQASTYAKVASDLEKKLLKNIETKGKALKTAIMKLEKKHITKLTKRVAKKSKKARKKSGTLKKVKSKKKAKDKQ